MMLVPDGYVSAYGAEAVTAADFYEDHRGLFVKYFPDAVEEERLLIYSIVAPEVSQYNVFRDFFEVKALQVKYVKDRSCDYSVGCFQMKPSFAESLESEIAKSETLRGKYGKMFSYKAKSAADKRSERVERLSSVEWQIKYLAVFVEVARQRTANWSIKGDAERLRCWATLYNSGFYLSEVRIKYRQKVKQFPRGTREFNYSAVALELYNEMKE